jgi:hypothetical protein
VKLEDSHFANGFLLGEDHSRISQVATKQARVLKVDDLNSLSY